MARMDYETFREYCFKNVVKAMGTETYEAKFNVIQKSDEEEHDAIQITEQGQKSGPMFNFRIKPFYLDYYDGKPLGEVILAIVKMMEETMETPPDFDIDILNSFDKAKDSLILRPLSYQRNKKLLNNHVYQRHEDIALVLYTCMKHSQEGMASAKVPKKTAGDWLAGEPYLLQTAMENTFRMFPPFLVPMEVLFLGEQGYKNMPAAKRFFMNPLAPFTLTSSITNTYYLSIDKGINGAVAVFYPGVLDRLCAIFDDDLYITLNSIRDASIHPASKFTIQMVKHAGAGGSSNPYINKDDFLSNNAYCYRRAERAFKILV